MRAFKHDYFIRKSFRILSHQRDRLFLRLLLDAKQDTRDKEHELKLMAQQSQD